MKHLNLSYIELMADGDDDMIKLLLEKLLDEPAKEMKKMKSFIEEKNYTELQFTAHKMKSTLSFVGSDSLTSINKKIETIAVTQENIPQLTSLIDDLINGFDIALIEIKETLKNYK
jgi:HPt (histidine-containing phosphotransfer) domain-containing protein